MSRSTEALTLPKPAKLALRNELLECVNKLNTRVSGRTEGGKYDRNRVRSEERVNLYYKKRERLRRE